MFPDQKPYENVELILRRHWLALLGHILRFIFLLAVGFSAYIYYTAYSGYTDSSALALFLLSVFMMIIWVVLFVGLVDYFLDTWIITDHRIVDISQCGFFKRNISELRYPKIEDVTVEIKGFIPTMFDYGDVVVQTAAEVVEFKFKQIPHPNQVKDAIFRMYDRYAKEHIGGEEIH